MATERWKTIERIFHEARQCGPDGRDAFLRKACAGDPSLRREVESLLEAQDGDAAFLAGPALGGRINLQMPLPAPLHEDGTLIGTQIGRYRLQKVIATGGMGTVFLAVRDDEAYQKRVAVKLIRHGMDNEEVMRRFRRERQALAALDHPNIATLLDGGTTDTGQPYLVMEYIEGRPIDAYCDDNGLSTMERIRLFRTVCRAVQYAHRKLIVHRDLKPGNILVTADGTVKLLDFGIAKLLDPELSRQDTATRADMHRFFTPDYASPEQIRGEAISTSSDVYSLGVVLYELLTGHRPYRVTTCLPHELERVVCEVEPVRPSSVIRRIEEITSRDGRVRATLTPESVSSTRDGRIDKLRRSLAGDVDMIVLMALRKEPERRYASVERFSEDLRRYLAGLPISARKSTIRYRTVKLVRRNKVAFLSSVLILFSLIGGITATLTQARRAGRERDRALNEANLSARRDAWLAYLFSVAGEVMVDETRVNLRVFLNQTAIDIIAKAEGQPDKQVSLMENFADLHASLMLHAGEVEWRYKILELQRDALSAAPGDIVKTRNLLAKGLCSLGDYDAADGHAEAALEAQTALSGRRHGQAAMSLHWLGWSAWRRGDIGKAKALLSESLAIRRDVLSDPSKAVVESLHALSALCMSDGGYGEAERHVRDGLAIVRRLYRGDHPLTARLVNTLGGVLQGLGRYEEAQTAYRQGYDMNSRLFGGDHLSTYNCLMQRAVLLKDMGDYEKAGLYALEVLEARKRLLGPAHPALASTLWHLAQIFEAKGDWAEAEAYCRESVSLYRKKWPEGHTDTAQVLAILGRLLIRREHGEEAEACLREAYELYRERRPDRWECAWVGGILGSALIRWQRYEEAETLLASCYRIVCGPRRAERMRKPMILKLMIRLYRAWGKPGKADEYQAALDPDAS